MCGFAKDFFDLAICDWPAPCPVKRRDDYLPMLTFLRDLSIRWKVIHIIMFTMTVALLIACATFMAYDYITFRDQQIKDSQALADLLGTSSTAALSFDDAQAVRDDAESAVR